MDCWSVALARVKGEGVLGIVVYSSSRICLHLGAMRRSHNGVELMPRFSLAQCLGSAEEKSARRYIIAERSGYGIGVRMAGLVHCSSLSYRK